MIKRRLIVNLLWTKIGLVQSINFKHTNVVGDIYTAIEFFNAWEADEIILLNVNREDKYFELFLTILERLSEQCFVPLSVGGWINSLERVEKLVFKGADKVVINTKAIQEPKFIKEVSKAFGSQCIVVSIDCKRHNDKHYVYIDRGRINTGKDIIEIAKLTEINGAGELMITSIDNDGSKKGYDLELIKKVVDNVSIPVIAFGGVGKWEHLIDGILIGQADAVAAGNIFHYYEQSTRKAKRALLNAGINVREIKNYIM